MCPQYTITDSVVVTLPIVRPGDDSQWLRSQVAIHHYLGVSVLPL